MMDGVRMWSRQNLTKFTRINMADNTLDCVHVDVGLLIYTGNDDVSPMSSEFDMSATLMNPVNITSRDITVCDRHRITPVVFIHKVVVHSIKVIVVTLAGWILCQQIIAIFPGLVMVLVSNLTINGVHITANSHDSIMALTLVVW